MHPDKNGFLHHLDSDGRKLYVALLVNFSLFGVTLTLVGATLPRLIRTFEWSYTSSGAILSAAALGYFAMTFLAGLLVHRLGPRRLVVAGMAVEVLGLALFGRHPSPVVNMLLTFLIGIGHGCTELTTNLSVIRLERPGESRLMNFAHATFCVGAVVGPLAVGGWLGMNPEPASPWRAVYPAAGVLVLAMALVLSRVRFRDEAAAHAASRERGRSARLPLLVILACMLFLYVSSEIGFSNWASEYFVRARGLDASAAATMVSALWAGILAGRLALSFWFRSDRQDLAIIGMSVLSALAVIFLTSVRSVALAALGVAIAGLGFSGVYPMVMSLVGRWFASGRAVGLATGAGGVGSFAFPFLMGYLGQTLGIATAFLLCAAASGVLALLAVAVTVLRPGSPRVSAPSSTA